MEGCGSSHADWQYTTSMRMYEKTSDYLILDEHVCDENAWEGLRMSESDLYLGRDWWVIYG